MKTTAKGELVKLTDDIREFVDWLMGRYCAAVRWSFKRLLEGRPTQAVRLAVQSRFGFNSRQANDAVADAQAVTTSQKKLVKLNHGNAKRKVEFTQTRLNKAKSNKKRERLSLRLEKEKRNLAKLQRFIDTNTFPAVVFGSKRLFRERCKGNISREEWLAARSNRYCSRGDRAKGGNLNARLRVENGDIFLDLVGEAYQIGKTVRFRRVSIPVYLAHKPSKKTGKINGSNYRQMVLDYLKTNGSYQVELLRRNNRYYIHVTIEEEVPQTYTPTGGVLGVDTNPNGLGAAQANHIGNYQESAWLPQGEWTYARGNRRMNLIGEAAADIVQKAKENESILAVEDLNFKDDRSVSAKFNRMSHGFVWSKFLAAVGRRAARESVPLAKVPPPFTSVVGVLKYQRQFGISAHQAAAYVIARRALGKTKEKVPKPLVARFVRNTAGFQRITNWKQWSWIKRAVLAAMKKQKEKEVKSLVSWQHHRKQLLAQGQP